MQFRKTLLAILAGAALASGAFAQTDKHNHGSHNTAESKESGNAEDHISAKDLKARLDKGEKVVIIDARHDLAGQILKGAVHLPSDKLEDWAKGVDKNTVIVTYCTCPHDEAADSEMHKLREMGFKNAYSLSGGLDAARAAGIEVVAPGDK
ncbi:MAG TPA: rhodanese-like domain-containing protein [Blastocatellia bacterium]|nr:rhodanese-like domain-containing protein [Blastocatellia bacterium]